MTRERAPGYSISVESDRIVVRHVGQLSVPEVEASRREVAELARERGLFLILLDLSRAAPSSLTTSEIFALCSTQWNVLPAGLAIAVVYGPGQFSNEDARLAENVSWNRGVTLRPVPDLEAAHRWLTEKTRPAPSAEAPSPRS